jgi:hypothetical protein
MLRFDDARTVTTLGGCLGELMAMPSKGRGRPATDGSRAATHWWHET